MKDHRLSCLIMLETLSNKSVYIHLSLFVLLSLSSHMSHPFLFCTFSSRELRFGGCYMYITAYSIIPQLLHNIKSPDCGSNEYHSRLRIGAFFSFSLSLSRGFALATPTYFPGALNLVTSLGNAHCRLETLTK